MKDTFQITPEEKEKILKSYFRHGLDGPLDTFPSKEKRKYIVAEEIIKRFEKDVRYNEKEVNDTIRQVYADFATIRRFFIDNGMMRRDDDGKTYWIEGEVHGSSSESEQGAV
ncbi:hypothetical protein NCCP2222_17760 [Sporosarcina sp. NCCP-2222]|uniref:DUF2087 domain-containing protein n=1 Tax=Sporosarcina sp. NCCP-2222 TaxID=2935073 RepID=UPI0020877294|nr:DUF2087 domain-containing protein [Sporosarcina sp. NCCP-2222]GKV55829.1 hypothetical protein NCCP2222_17760 [Sporosarcina sp. NCCP-2222]